ncbi:MAG: phosphatidylserine decarboxylase [Planctomycetota bacterium]
MPFTRHGFRELLVGSLVLALTGFALGWVWWPLALVILPALVFLFAFFRDPERSSPDDVQTYVSPADGKVSDVTTIDDDPLVGGPATRVGIFLSVFNVHVNRSPCDGVVKEVIYKKGKFINALDHAKASDENESNTLVIADPETGEVRAVVKQIVGLIARRIVCTKQAGDTVTRGERIGMIKFGSRTELTVPKALYPDVLVAVGDKVQGARTVMVGVGETHDEAEPLASTTPV